MSTTKPVLTGLIMGAALLVEDKRETLNEAVAGSQTAVDEVTDRETLVEGIATLQAEAAKVDITRDEYVADLGCG